MQDTHVRAGMYQVPSILAKTRFATPPPLCPSPHWLAAPFTQQHCQALVCGVWIAPQRLLPGLQRCCQGHLSRAAPRHHRGCLCRGVQMGRQQLQLGNWQWWYRASPIVVQLLRHFPATTRWRICKCIGDISVHQEHVRVLCDPRPLLHSPTHLAAPSTPGGTPRPTACHWSPASPRAHTLKRRLHTAG